MFLLFIFDIFIYILIVLILHIILKKKLDTVSTSSLESFTKDENKTKHTTDNTDNDTHNANNNVSETEEDTASWDEVHVSEQPVNTEQNAVQPKLTLLDDRKLFNHSNSNRLQVQDNWEGNNHSELLQNNFNNSLDEQYSSLSKDVASIQVTQQSYDNVLSLRSREFDSYFSQKNEVSAGVDQSNPIRPMLDINNKIGDHLNVHKIKPAHSHNVLADDIHFSNNTLNYKSLDNTTMFTKNTPIVDQYKTVKQFTDGEQFLKKEQVDNMDKTTIQDNRERKLKKEGVRLSDVRNTYAISNNNLIGEKNKIANQLQAYEDNGNLATI